MDTKHVASKLDETADLLKSIADTVMKTNSKECLHGECQAALMDAYWNLNRIWNTRLLSAQEYADQHDKMYDEWCRYPVDLDCFYPEP